MAEETKTEETVVTPPVVETPPPAADARVQIDALATSFGYDPAHFAAIDNVDAARIAIKLAVETGANRPAPAANLPSDRFSKPQSEPTTQSISDYKPIDYKALGLDDDDAAAKALRLQEERIKASDSRVAAIEARLVAQQREQQEQANQLVMQQADDIISGFASTRYGTSVHRTPVQEAAMEHLIRMAGTIRQNSGGRLPLQACLNQARLLDEGTTTAMNTMVPAKKTAGSELPQGGSPSLSEGIKKMRITDQWSQNPEFRAKYGLEPAPSFQ